MLMSGGGQQERVGNEWPTQGILIQLAVGQSDGVIRIACSIFTPLRVGWPPTPQVYFGP